MCMMIRGVFQLRAIVRGLTTFTRVVILVPMLQCMRQLPSGPRGSRHEESEQGNQAERGGADHARRVSHASGMRKWGDAHLLSPVHRVDTMAMPLPLPTYTIEDKDNIIFDITLGASAGGFGHPTCLGGVADSTMGTNLPTAYPLTP